jgi:iron complex outermembrane receptor protein
LQQARNRGSYARLACFLSLCLQGISSSAQTLEEVIVTATLRPEPLMSVPLAISAISGEFIDSANLRNIKDVIAYAPGVTGSSSDSYINNVSIRGIYTQDFGAGGDPSVAFYKDSLYQGRDGSAVSSLYDIERAEILRGPQGFLFGRGSIAGAISVVTVKPDLSKSGGYLDVASGSRD